METIVCAGVAALCGVIFTVIGIYSINRDKPMRFNSANVVKEEEISDIPAYNRANGIMWIAFSLVFWIALALSFFFPIAAATVQTAGCFIGVPILSLVYHRIYQKYKADPPRDRRE